MSEVQIIEEYRANHPPEPEALIRVAAGGVFAFSDRPTGQYNRGTIVGVSSADAAHYISQGLAVAVTREERDLELAKAREEQAAREDPAGLRYFRFLISWAVHGCYYVRGEIAAWRGEQAEYVAAARTKEGQAFVEEIAAAENEMNLERQRLDNEARQAAEEEASRLVLVRFLRSITFGGVYYNGPGEARGPQGETAGFRGQQLRDLLEARTVNGEPFVELTGEVIYPDGRPVEASA
jgi:hypothetical protein